MTTDTEWLDERIAAARLLVVAHEDAIAALTAGAQTYTLDTGQTRQSVTKADLGSLRLGLNSAETRLDRLCSRRSGGAAVVLKPGF